MVIPRYYSYQIISLMLVFWHGEEKLPKNILNSLSLSSWAISIIGMAVFSFSAGAKQDGIGSGTSSGKTCPWRQFEVIYGTDIRDVLLMKEAPWSYFEETRFLIT